MRNKGMSDLINMVVSNTLYLIITVCILGVMVYFGMKKMTKLFIFALIVLIAFLSYVYYTGESVENTVDKAGEIVK
jgi:cell division protein FtsW (lipid II flippase)